MMPLRITSLVSLRLWLGPAHLAGQVGERVPVLVDTPQVGAERAASLYHKLIDPKALVEPTPDGKALLVRDFPDQVARFRRVMALLEREGAGDKRVFVRPVRFRDPDELVALLSEVGGATERLDAEFVTDARTGQLIVVATREVYARLHRLIERLDLPESGAGERRVWVEPSPPGGVPPIGSTTAPQRAATRR
jgi:type II secretory pathway component GspD/PulD (secretin)